MTEYESNSDKTGRYDLNPATVELDDGTTIEAAHHITTGDNRLLHLYIEERQGGIDVTVPLCSDKNPWARSAVGRDALTMTEEQVLMADGGLGPGHAQPPIAELAADARRRRAEEAADDTPCENPSCGGVATGLDDTCSSQCWHVMDTARRIIAGDDVDVYDEYKDTVQRAVDALTDDADDADDDDDDRRVMTDGGQPVEDDVDMDDFRERLEDADVAGSTDDDDQGVENVTNADDVVVARARGIEGLADYDGGAFECVECGATSDTEHGAKVHFGRAHPDSGTDDEDDDAPGVDVVAAVEEHIDNKQKRTLKHGLSRVTGVSDDLVDVDGVTIRLADAMYSRHTHVYVAVGTGVDVSDVRSIVDALPWRSQEAKIQGPYIVVAGRPNELHDVYSEYYDAFAGEHRRPSDVMGVEASGAVVTAEPPVDWSDDDDLVTDTGDDEDDEDDEGDGETTWDDVEAHYDAASVGSSPVSKADARDKCVEALEDETDWMSIVERSESGAYDLWNLTDEGWDEDGYTHCQTRMREELGAIASDTEVNHIVAQLATANYVEEENTNAQHLDETLIPILNGVINVDGIEYDPESQTIDWGTVEVQNMQPNEHRFLYRVQTEWDPENADLDGLDTWLETITRNDEARRIIWEMAGHALHPRYPVDAMLVFLGDGGSGKSQTLEVIKQTLGSDNTSVKTLTAIQKERFAGKHVVDSRANINTELTGTKFKSINKLKTYSAGEEDSVEGKGTASYKSPNDATMMFASDDPPSFPTNRALGRRLYPVEFPCSYVSDPDPDNPYELQSRPKLEVQAELQADARLKAALIRAVEGLKRLLEEGDPTSSKSWEERVAQYESYADPIHDFARNALVPDDGSAVETSDMKATFDAFADAKDHDGKTMQQIVDVLEEMPAYPISKDRTRGFAEDKTKHTVYKGIAFSEDARENWVPDSAYWQAYGGRPDARDDGDADTDRRAVVTLEAGGGRVEDPVRVTVKEQQDDPAYSWDDQGVLGDGTDSIRYKIEHGARLKEGAKYEVEKFIVGEMEGARIVHIVPGMTETTMVDDGSRDEGQDPITDDADGDAADADGEELSQDDRVQELKNVIGAAQNRKDVPGAGVERVLDTAEDRGIDRGTAERDLEKLRRDGGVYEPKTGRVTLTSGGE